MVSVVIPNYNHAAYLEQRLRSVIEQTYTDFELIILDDCSTDASREVIEKYRGHEKVSAIIYNQQNSGSTFLQWQKGIGLSKGEYIWIAESDDWCEPSFLEQMMLAMNKDPAIVLAYAQSCYISHPDKINWVSFVDRLETILRGKEFVDSRMLTTNSVFNASMAVFRRTAFDAISDSYTHYRFCGDWLFWIELSMQGKVYISGRILNYFRNHDRDVSSAAARSGLQYVEQAKMFRHLRSQRVINDAALTLSIGTIYADLKISPFRFSGLEKEQIEKALFDKRNNRFRLNKNYYGLKTKRIFKRYLNQLFS